MKDKSSFIALRFHFMEDWACGSVVEHVPDKNGVEGSIPSTPTKNTLTFYN